MRKMILSNIHFFTLKQGYPVIIDFFLHEFIRNVLFKKHITKTYPKKMKPK